MIDRTKTSIALRFSELYGKLSEPEKENFSLACSKLLCNNFIYGQRYHDDNLYRVINRLRDPIEHYFALIDYELIHDDSYKIFFIRSMTPGTKVKLKKLETVLVLVLAKLYSTKSMDVGSGLGVEVSVVLQEVLDEINKTRIFKERLNKGDLSSAIKTLKKYKVIDVGSTDVTSIDVFNVLPTINYVVPEQDLVDIENRLRGLSLLEDLDQVEEDEDETEEN